MPTPVSHEMLLVGAHPLSLEGIRMVHVTPDSLDSELLTDDKATVKVVLLDGSQPEQALALAQRLRQHPSPAVYLAPVLVLESEAVALPAALAQAVDGVAKKGGFASQYAQQFADRVSAMHQRRLRLAEGAQARDSNLAIKFLRHLFVRSGKARPVHDILNPHGYHYPELDLYLHRSDDNLFEILGFLESQRLLAGEFVDKIHLCGRCGTAFLNFRETCPHCHSAHLQVDDLVHHFRCGHVAPMTDYQRQGGLRCPKCEHGLRQIGVDYDKPSAVYICQDCGHTTQEPETSSLCYGCGAVSVPEHLGQQIVKSYTLTGLGENAAQYGLDNLFRSILESELDLLPLAVFKRFLSVEVERTKRYRRSRSSLVMFHVLEMDRIYLEAGPRAKEIFGEFGRILRAVLRPSDVITAFNDSLFLVLATETPADGAASMASRVTERLDALMRSNFARSVRIITDHVELVDQTDADELLDMLVRQQSPAP